MPTVEKASRTDTGLASTLRVSIARLNRRLRTEHVEGAEEIRVNVTGIAVLAILYRTGDLSIGQLAANERVQPPSMTRTVSCLEGDGLVERHAHPTDGRQVVVRLTKRGEDYLLADRRRRDAWLACRLRELTPEERTLLRQAAPLLDRLSNS
jgi:DNA-binding MarR family transcriptional regulator